MKMVENRVIRIGILLILSTAPLLYGARHPMIHGLYSSVILLLCGSWVISHYSSYRKPFPALSFLHYFPIFLICYIYATSLSLPLPLLEIIAPQRAESLGAAMAIGGAVEQHTSLAYYAPSAEFYAIYGLALFFLFIVSVSLFQSRRFLKRYLLLITIIGTFEALYGILQAMDPNLGVLWSGSAADQYRGMARGTIIYRNQYALFLNLCWPAAAAFGVSLLEPLLAKYKSKLRQRKRMSFAQTLSHFSDKALLPIFGSALMILAVILSQSRGGIITLALTAALFTALLPFSRKSKLFSLAIIGTLILIYMMMIGGFIEITQRFENFVSSAEGRLHIWLASVSLLSDHLFTGIGMGGYEWLSPLYLENMPDRIWYDRAHNEYLELLIELGAPVALALYAWIGAGFIHCSRSITAKIKAARIAGQRFSTLDFAKVGAYCSVVAFLLHGLVDFVWRLPANLIYLVTLLAMLTAVPAKLSAKEQGERQWSGAL